MTYTLATYGGTLTGDATNLALQGITAGTTRQSFTFSAGTGTNSAITLAVSGSPANLTFVGNAANNAFDLVTTANFSGGTVVPPGTAPDNRFYNLDAVAFTQSGVGGAANPVAVTGTLAPGGITVSGGQDYLLSGTGTITGTGGLAKGGTGTFTLAVPTTYSGGTTVTGGTLQIGNGGTAGSVAGDIVNNAAVVFNRSDAVGYTGTISGSGTVGVAGGGTLTLSGANTYQGTTTVSGGSTLAVAADGNLGAGQLVLANGTLAPSAALTTARPLGLGTGGGTLSNAAALTLNGLVSDTGATPGGLTKSGAGGLALNATNTFSGGLTVNGGALTVGATNATGTGPVVFNSLTTLTVTNPAVTLASSIALPAAAGRFTVVTPDNSSTVLNGSLSGGVAGDATAGTGTEIFFQGGTGGSNTGALTLNGNNSGLQGYINVQRGPLVLGNANAIGQANIRLDSNLPPGGALQFAGSFAVPSSVRLQSGANTGVGVGAGLTGELTGVVSSNGTLGIAKVGAGTLVLSGANTYTGTTLVNAGALLVNGDNTAATGATTVAAAATLGGRGTVGGAVTVNGTLAAGTATATPALAVNGAVALSGTAKFAVTLFGTGPADVSLVNAGANAVTIDPAARLTLDLSQVDAAALRAGGPKTYTVVTTLGAAGNFTPGNLDYASLGNFDPSEFSISAAPALGTVQLQFTPVPEPAAVVGVAALALGGLRLRRRGAA